MLIINSVSDIKRLADSGAISGPLASHLMRKIDRIRVHVDPETPIEQFQLTESGTFGVLETRDKDLHEIGVPDLSVAMPEFVTRLGMGTETFFVAYFLSTNDVIEQVYMPDAVTAGSIRLWLSEQPLEEETDGGDENASQGLPF